MSFLESLDRPQCMFFPVQEERKQQYIDLLDPHRFGVGTSECSTETATEKVETFFLRWKKREFTVCELQFYQIEAPFEMRMGLMIAEISGDVLTISSLRFAREDYPRCLQVVQSIFRLQIVELIEQFYRPEEEAPKLHWIKIKNLSDTSFNKALEDAYFREWPVNSKIYVKSV